MDRGRLVLNRRSRNCRLYLLESFENLIEFWISAYTGIKPQRSSHMKRIIPFIVINIALASFAFGQSKIQKESADSNNEQEVRQAIEKYRAALLRRDIPMLEQIWADDYFFVNAAGEMLTKAQRLANLKSGATTLESINEEEELKVRVHQNTAVATSRVTIKGQYSGQQTSGQYRSIHIWIKGPTGWQLVANQLTALAPK
jgi:ketosteroid isomerase-like protein